MEKFCDFITNPDWWSVIATFVAAIVAAVITYVLGRRQNDLQEQQVKLQEQQNKIQEYQTKLQEQQIHQQEYSIYRQLYKLVKKADNEIDTYLDEITDSLGVIPRMRADVGFLKCKYEYIEQIRNELEENILDFEIKFTKEFVDLKRYKKILYVMVHNLKLIDEQVEKGMVAFDERSSIRIDNVEGSIEKGKAYYIAQHIKDENYKDAICSNLFGFIEQREKLREGANDILGKIRYRCKVE